MGSPYNKMISAKFYVEKWVGRLDTFFRHKRYFCLFSTQKIFFYTYRYRSRAGEASSPSYKAADHTGGGPSTSPGKERNLGASDASLWP